MEFLDRARGASPQELQEGFCARIKENIVSLDTRLFELEYSLFGEELGYAELGIDQCSLAIREFYPLGHHFGGLRKLGIGTLAHMDALLCVAGEARDKDVVASDPGILWFSYLEKLGIGLDPVPFPEYFRKSMRYARRIGFRYESPLGEDWFERNLAWRLPVYPLFRTASSSLHIYPADLENLFGE